MRLTCPLCGETGTGASFITMGRGLICTRPGTCSRRPRPGITMLHLRDNPAGVVDAIWWYHDPCGVRLLAGGHSEHGDP